MQTYEHFESGGGDVMLACREMHKLLYKRDITVEQEDRLAEMMFRTKIANIKTTIKVVREKLPYFQIALKVKPLISSNH